MHSNSQKTTCNKKCKILEMLEIRLTSCHFWKWSTNVFVCWRIKKFYFLFKGQTTSMNSGSQSPKGILENYALWIFLSSIISDFYMENHLDLIILSSIFYTFNNRTQTCLFVLINFEVLCKCSLKEHLRHPLQHLF